MEGSKFLVSTLMLFTLTDASLQYCVLRANCTVDNSSCIPNILDYTDANATAPVKWDIPEDLKGVCPDYDDKPSCCNQFTMQTMQTKLVSVDLTFGNPSTGCSNCANNMKRFFCKYSCDPDQHLFIIPGQSRYTEFSPGKGQDPIKVVESNISVDAAGACALYESCKRVDFVKALGSMSSYVGFFNTLSSQGITQGNVIMNYQFGNKEGAIKADINKCSQVFNTDTDQYNYKFTFGQGWCNCQHCSYNCSGELMDFSAYVKKHGVLDGLDSSVVSRAAVFSSVLLLVVLLIRCFVLSDDKSKKHPYEINKKDDYSAKC